MIEVVSAVSTIAGTLGGVWVGHWLSERASQRRERAEDAKRRHSIRMLLRVEIDQNLAALAAFWADITERSDAPPDPFHDALHLAPRLIDRPPPMWSQVMWESQAPLLAAALDPSEIDAAYRLYADLRAITAHRDHLSGVHSADDVRTQAKEPDRYEDGITTSAPSPPQYFSGLAVESWPELSRLVREALSAGNPIRGD